MIYWVGYVVGASSRALVEIWPLALALSAVAAFLPRSWLAVCFIAASASQILWLKAIGWSLNMTAMGAVMIIGTVAILFGLIGRTLVQRVVTKRPA